MALRSWLVSGISLLSYGCCCCGGGFTEITQPQPPPADLSHLQGTWTCEDGRGFEVTPEGYFKSRTTTRRHAQRAVTQWQAGSPETAHLEMIKFLSADYYAERLRIKTEDSCVSLWLDRAGINGRCRPTQPIPAELVGRYDGGEHIVEIRSDGFVRFRLKTTMVLCTESQDLLLSISALTIRVILYCVA